MYQQLAIGISINNSVPVRSPEVRANLVSIQTSEDGYWLTCEYMTALELTRMVPPLA